MNLQELLHHEGIRIPEINYREWLKLGKSGSSAKIGSGASDSFSRQVGRLYKALPDNDPLKITLDKPNRVNISMDTIRDMAKDLADKLPNEDEKGADKVYQSIFSAIQTWGGGGGRTPFTKRASYDGENPMIKTPEYWLKDYIHAVDLFKQSKFIEGIKYMNEKIKGIQTPFSTKHAWFWSEYFKEKGSVSDVQPIFDNMLGLLFVNKNANPNLAERIRKDAYPYIRDRFGLGKYTDHDIEQALFAFAFTYFNNSINGWKNNKTLEQTLQRDLPLDSNNNPLDIEEAEAILRNRGINPEIGGGNVRDEDDDRPENVDEAYSVVLPGRTRRITAKMINDSMKNRNNKTRKGLLSILTDYDYENDENIPDDVKEAFDYIKDLAEENGELENINETWNKWAKWATR
jgi:hypothetical protein